MSYLETLRDRAGIGSNTELAERVREVGSPRFNASVISKWKTGATEPGLESLRAIAKVVKVEPMHLFLRSGLIKRDDLGQRQVHPVYEDLVQLDHDMEDHEIPQVRTGELERLRAHIGILVSTTRGTISQLAEAAGNSKPLRRRRRAG